MKEQKLAIYFLGGLALASLLGIIVGKTLIYFIERSEVKRSDGVVYASDGLNYTAPQPNLKFNTNTRTRLTDGKYYSIDIYWNDCVKKGECGVNNIVVYSTSPKKESAFEFTDGTCYRETIFNNGKPIMSDYCKDGRLAESPKIEATTGKSSWYDYSLPGHPNYSKENYTAASRDYPKGTKLVVCSSLKNYLPIIKAGEIFEKNTTKKCITVRVNDYGPEEWTGNVIDLSSAAFNELAPLSRGIIDVEITKI